MADISPTTWRNAAIWIAVAVVLLLVIAWASGVFESPPAPTPEVQQPETTEPETPPPPEGETTQPQQ